MELQRYLFAETAPFTDEQSRQEAINYLNMWKKVALQKLRKDTYSATLVDEIWSERDAKYDGVLCQRSWMILKIKVEITFNFERCNYGLRELSEVNY